MSRHRALLLNFINRLLLLTPQTKTQWATSLGQAPKYLASHTSNYNYTDQREICLKGKVGWCARWVRFNWFRLTAVDLCVFVYVLSWGHKLIWCVFNRCVGGKKHRHLSGWSFRGGGEQTNKLHSESGAL